MYNEILSKELVRLASGCINNKIQSDELCKVIKNILNENDYILDEILQDALEFTSSFEVISLLQDISEQLSYSKRILGKDGKTYYSNLFAIPVVFVKEEGSSIESIEKFTPELEKIAKILRQTNVFNHECSIHIHNQLFSPEQLMLLDYNYIYSFLNEMTNVCFDKPANIVDAPQYETEICEEKTLYIRYLFGVRVFKQEAPELTEEEEYSVLADFNEKAVPTLSKILDGNNVAVIGVDEFYPAVRSGLEFYSSLSRKIDIEQCLKDAKITPETCKALITIDLNDIEDSYIELSSSFSGRMIGVAKIYPLKHQEAKELIGVITEELAELGFEMDHVHIQVGENTYPIDFFLKHEDDLDIISTVTDFLDNPDIDED